MILAKFKTTAVLGIVAALWLSPYACGTNTFTTSYHILEIGGAGAFHSPGFYSSGGATLDVEPTPFPSITADAPAHSTVSMSGDITYPFEYDYIGTGTPDGSLLVDIRVILHTNADPQGGIGQAFMFFDDNITPASAICNYGFTCANPDYDAVLQFVIAPNEQHSVDIGAQANGTGSGPGFSFAYADPYIYIDPSVVDAADYSLVLPADIGNQDPSAPEPASIAMMTSGIGAIVWRLRRRNQ